METWGEKDLCLLWEWVQEYLGRSGQVKPLSTYGGLGQNLIDTPLRRTAKSIFKVKAIGERTIFGVVFQKRQHVSYYVVSH